MVSIGQNFGFGNYGFNTNRNNTNLKEQNNQMEFQRQENSFIQEGGQMPPNMPQNGGMNNQFGQNNFGGQPNQNGFGGFDSFGMNGFNNFNQNGFSANNLPNGQNGFGNSFAFNGNRGINSSFAPNNNEFNSFESNENGFQPQMPNINSGSFAPNNAGFPNGNSMTPPEKPDTDFAGLIAAYLVENEEITEEEAANKTADLANSVIHDPVEAVKVYFGITDEQEAIALAEKIFGVPREISQDNQQQNFFMQGL